MEVEDEWSWALDDAQTELGEDESEIVPRYESADAFISTHPIPEGAAHLGRLPLPVVLPQRRPKARARGFVRAYAPVLENAGIDQKTWLSFLDLFQKSSAANPLLDAINLAAFAGFAVPHFGGAALGIIIGQMVNLAKEFDARGKANNFLHQMNAEFFQPRGLYCLVMTYDPNSARQVEQVNIAHTIASRSGDGEAGSHKYRSSDGTTSGAMAFPETAPLIFPSLDQLAAETSKEGEKKARAFAKEIAFVGDYWDRRATAEYTITNSDTPLAQVPQPEFRSRYADPKTHAASGSLLAFVSGGKLIPNPESRGLIGGLANVAGQAIRGEKQGSGWEGNQPGYRPAYGLYGRGLRGRYSMSYGTTAGQMVSAEVGSYYNKVMGKNVLYLMVVNMPDKEEMEAAAQQEL